MSPAKRILLFVILGPFIGFVTAFWVMLPILTVTLGERPDISLGQVVILPAAFVLGALPAALVGAIDHLLAKMPWRPIWTGLAGYLLGFIPILGALLLGFMHGPFVLLFGLIGAVPALISSIAVSLIEKRQAGIVTPSS
jgi:hypothetical protein